MTTSLYTCMNTHCVIISSFISRQSFIIIMMIAIYAILCCHHYLRTNGYWLCIQNSNDIQCTLYGVMKGLWCLRMGLFIFIFAILHTSLKLKQLVTCSTIEVKEKRINCFLEMLIVHSFSLHIILQENHARRSDVLIGEFILNVCRT